MGGTGPGRLEVGRRNRTAHLHHSSEESPRPQPLQLLWVRGFLGVPQRSVQEGIVCLPRSRCLTESRRSPRTRTTPALAGP